jgi:hypothetical protein
MTEIYKPPGCLTLEELGDSQIRVGIQGAPFTGKTWASLSFPNPIILSLDRKVSAHGGDNVMIVPFHDVGFIDKIVKRPGTKAPPSTKDAILEWLLMEGTKLAKNQTLIVDGSTAVEEAFHTWYRYNEDTLAMTKSGQIDAFVEWSLKKDFFGDLFSRLKSIPCNVVYIVHEAEKSDKDNNATGKIRPLMTGQVRDRLCGNFTDWFRSHVISKPVNEEQRKKLKEWGGVDDSTIKEWIDSTPTSYQSIHLWQTQPDSICDCGTTSLVGAPKYIIADYKMFAKYKRNKQP